MDFTAQSVINSFIQNEAMLKDVLNIVPYSEEHLNVWSPILATVLLESCSQLDSLWKYRLKDLDKKYLEDDFRIKIPDRPKMTNHFSFWGGHVALSWVVFWGGLPTMVTPFDAWKKDGKPKPPVEYAPLDWWVAYNKLKHDRFLNQNKATLYFTVRALAGLFVAIIKSDFCQEAILQANWLSASEYVPEKPFDRVSPYNYVTIETNLFSYAAGWEKEQKILGDAWQGPASHRFRAWFEKYHLDEE